MKLKRSVIVIAGVHKGATTSMYEYLMQHDDICAGRTKEIHYYTPLRYGRELKPFEAYTAEFRDCGSERYVLDASPSYLYGGDLIAERIGNDFEGVKVIMMLREPTDRFVSFFNFLKSDFRLEGSVSFPLFMERSYELRDHDDTDDIYYRAFREGCYAEYLEPWLRRFGKDVKIVFFDDLKRDAAGTMRNLCRWLGIDETIYRDPAMFEIKNKTRASKFKWVFLGASKINTFFEGFFRRHPRVKGGLRGIYFALFGARKQETVNAEDRDALRLLYREENRKLAKLLRQYGVGDLPAWLQFDDTLPKGND